MFKARGSKVKEYVACASLYKGFDVYSPVKTLKSSDFVGRTYEPPTDLPKCYTTDIHDLDTEIKGYPTGSSILYEIEQEITDHERFIITVPILLLIFLERTIIVIPHTGVELIDIINLQNGYGVPSNIFNTKSFKHALTLLVLGVNRLAYHFKEGPSI